MDRRTFWQAVLDGKIVQLGEVFEAGEIDVVNAVVSESEAVIPDRGGLHDGLEAHCGRSVLMVASSRGHLNVVILLLEKGAPIDFQDEYGKSALMVSSENGRYDVVELLLDKGTCIDLKDKFGKSALMVASKNWHYRVVDLLLGRGAKVSFEDEVGCQALLQLACTGGKIQVARSIIENLLLTDLRSLWERALKTSLDLALSYGHQEVSRLLLETGVPMHRGSSAVSTSACLADACRRGNYGLVRLMIKRGAVVDIKALNAACEGRHLDMVKLLLELNGGVDRFVDGGVSALRAACGDGSLNCCWNGVPRLNQVTVLIQNPY